MEKKITDHVRRKFRSETSDNMDSWKAEVRRVRREKIRRKKMQMREKVGKSRFTVFFQWFVAPEGRKVGSLKRRVRSQLARWEMKKCTPLWCEAHLQAKMYKTHQLRTTFGSCDVEKVHAVVARSTFPSENVQNTPGSDHFWRLRCRVSKKCTPLWREAYLEVNMLKTLGFRTTFGGSDVASLNSTTLHYTTLCCTTLHYTTLRYITLHYTSQHYRFQLQLHNYSPLHSTTLHYTKLHCTTLSTLHFTTLHYTSLHYTTLHDTTTTTSTTFHYTPLH